MTLAWEINVPFLLLLFHMRVCISTFVNVVVLYRIRSGQSHTIRATGTSHIRTVPNYNHVATTYGYVTYYYSLQLGCVLLASSAVADLGARDLLVWLLGTDSDLPDPLATESYYL